MRPPRRAAIVQSNYIPWKGYFDLIASVDVFVLYDDAQYTKRDWRNRNRIKTAAGARWLTIPVQVSGRYHQRIRDVVIDEAGWNESHWRTLVHHYRRVPEFTHHAGALEALYRTASMPSLSEVNRHLLSGVCALLGIATPLRWSHEFELPGDASARLLAMCEQLDATEYVSGPAARGYLDVDAFARAGIAVAWADYSGYSEYRQPYPPFEHQVSIVDLLLCEGAAARSFLKQA